MKIKFINNTKLAVLTLLFITLFIKPVTYAASRTNENTADINITVTDNEIKVHEKWKVIIEQDNFKRNLNVDSGDLHSVVAQLIYPTVENMDYTTKAENKGTAIDIKTPDLKGKEIVLTLEYSLNNSKDIFKSLENNEEYNLLYPNTENNVKPAKIDINLKSNVMELDDRENTYTGSIKTQGKVKNSDKSDTSIVTNKKTKNKSETTKTTEKKVNKKSIFDTVKSVLLDIFVLIGCTLLISLIALLAFLAYRRYVNGSKRKFNKRNRNVKKNKKRKFK